MKLSMRLTVDGLVRGLRLRAHRLAEVAEPRGEPEGRHAGKRAVRAADDRDRPTREAKNGIRRA